MSAQRHALDIWLSGVLVGRLAILTEKSGRCDFRFHSEYMKSYPRPVLGQAFEEDVRASYFHRTRLPAFFANLLPEGGLRAMAQRQIKRQHRHEIHLLAMLGEDLPGAVRAASPDSAPPESPGADHEDRERSAELPRLRFALSGVQLKMSVLRESSDRLTVPASGLGGDWIVKFPHGDLTDLPENEHAMMTWARLVGIDVPSPELFPIESIDGLPDSLRALGSIAYGVPRFDRRPDKSRVHMEDFAQVLSCYPEDKYDGMTYERLAILSSALAGRRGLEETLRRLVFIVATGNGDAHMKNWSLLYPDGLTPEVSPAYDLVSTVCYRRFSDVLALPFHRSDDAWEDVSMESFDRIADACALARPAARALVEETIVRIATTAKAAEEQSRWAREGWKRLAEHWRRIPLLRGHSID